MEANVRHERRDRVRRLVCAAALATAVAVTLTASPEEEAARPELRAISSRMEGAVSTVLIEASEPVAYVTSQPDPQTVFVDLRNVAAGFLPQSVGPMPPVMDVRVEEATAPDGTPMARVRVTLDRAVTPKVRSSRNIIYVEVPAATAGTLPTGVQNGGAAAGVPPPSSTVVRNAGSLNAGTSDRNAGSPVTRTPVESRIEPAPGSPVTNGVRAETRAATTISSVRALPNGEGIAIAGNGTLVASRVEEARDMPPRVLLDFENVAARGVPAVTDIRQGDVERVRVGVNSTSPLITRVVIDLARRLAYRVVEAGEELRVLFERTNAAAAEPITAAPPAGQNGVRPRSDAATEMSPVAPPESPAVNNGVRPRLEPVTELSSAPAAPPVAPAAAAAAATPSAPPSARIESPLVLNVQQTPAPPPPIGTPPAQPAPGTRGRYIGDPVSFDFQGADLRSVLRTFAEISGLNIVIDPSIQGSVDVVLKDVPWDQALDIILKANKLDYVVDGTVVRIAPVTVLAQEEKERRELQREQALAGELRVLTLPLSYAKAPELVSILTRSALSERGEVQIDTRTNTLIIKDLADRLTTAADLVKTLDRPQPQVEIEARIVQTNRDFARAIGVQWGFNGRVDPTLGNTTPLAFPNSGSLTGRVGGVQGPAQGDTAADTGVALGVTAPMSALGIALGSVNGALNLDVVLSQLERAGNGRLLSTPRVTTQNNVEAEMTQGVQIPIQTVANNTVTVTFKDAALILRVTPQITASNTIIMRVNLENATPDFSRAVNGIPPIDTQRAITTVLVGDGETTVIGGIYVSREQATQGRVPLLHRLPLLGWLFKRDEVSDESRELLIFITPRITRS